MDKKIVKLKKPRTIILDYGSFELELKENSTLCAMIETINMSITDERVYSHLKDNNLIKEEMSNEVKRY